MNELSTKEKILKTALSLFSEKGFNGVGIREISTQAEVNISAVNYHFQNKENLYLETIKMCMLETSQNIYRIYQSMQERSTEDLALAIFDFFNENKEGLRINFKLMLNNDFKNFPDMNLMDEREELIGPPGGGAIFDSLKKEAPSAKDEDIIWAVRILFSQILHKSLIICNDCHSYKKRREVANEDVFKSAITRLVRVILEELKNPRHPI